MELEAPQKYRGMPSPPYEETPLNCKKTIQNNKACLVSQICTLFYLHLRSALSFYLLRSHLPLHPFILWKSELRFRGVDPLGKCPSAPITTLASDSQPGACVQHTPIASLGWFKSGRTSLSVLRTPVPGLLVSSYKKVGAQGVEEVGRDPGKVIGGLWGAIG